MVVDFGLEQIIEVGPMSGKSNIVYWLERRGVAVSDDLVQRIFHLAKHSDRLLTADQISACCASSRSDARTPS
jgi:2-isopropylmalate synthase